MRIQTRLQADRWHGFRRIPIERTDLRQRLQLDAYDLLDLEVGRLDFFLDTEVGSDLGPTPGALEAAGRERAVLDLFDAELVARLGSITARLGRHVLMDVLGFDALDGLSTRLDATPWLSLEGVVGFASRRGGSDFGPDVYAQDGLAMPDESATVTGLGVQVSPLDWAALAASWRRRASTYLEQDTLGTSARLRPLAGVELTGGATRDLVFERWSDLWLELSALVGATDGRFGWRRVEPVFSADSIWWSFGGQPHQALTGGVGLRLDDWHLLVGSENRRFDDGTEAIEWAYGGTFRVTRHSGRHGAHLGLESRLTDGYGGTRRYANLFGRHPWVFAPGEAPLWIRWRLGAVLFEDSARTTANGPSGWALLATRWAASSRIFLDTLVEGHLNTHEPYRLRVMVQLTAESWW